MIGAFLFVLAILTKALLRVHRKRFDALSISSRLLSSSNQKRLKPLTEGSSVRLLERSAAGVGMAMRGEVELAATEHYFC